MSAQKPIKITTEIDQFTGDTTLSTEAFEYRDMVSYGGGLLFALYLIDGKTYLIAMISTDGISTVDQGDPLMMKMVDGSMITLACAEYSSADYRSGSTWWLSGIYGLPEDDLTTLSKTHIEMVRIKTSDGNIDMAPSPKKAPENCMAAFKQFTEYVKK